MEIKIKTDRMFYDITDKVEEFAKGTGFIVVQSMHTTAGVKVMENEKYLLQDLERYLERLVPRGERYDHDDIERRDVPSHERKNAYSHLRSFFANTCEIIPVVKGKLQLGEWQKIMFVEFDIGRERTIKLYEIRQS